MEKYNKNNTKIDQYKNIKVIAIQKHLKNQKNERR
jgi:hypothetical protein